MRIKTFLPGEMILQRGGWSDYIALHKFHYLPNPPAAIAQVWRIVHRTDADRVVAVGVLCWPSLGNKTRHRVLRLRGKSFGERLRFNNRYLRTISRVIVHPQYRALGLASKLVRCICRNCPTRYVEAMAQMGRAHPFFESAGMRRVDPLDPTEPVYFIFKRKQRNRRCKRSKS